MPNSTSPRRVLTVLAAGVLALASTPVAAPAVAADADYYDAARGLSGERLKDALHGIISTGATTITYHQVWDALRVTDEDPGNRADVMLFYSGFSRSKSRNGGGKGQWNREHVWPQSHGNLTTNPGPGTDLHHLRPEDPEVNGDRGNKDFDVSDKPYDKAPGNRVDGDSWEPRDAVKGDVARMVFYMAVRYEDRRKDLEVSESVVRDNKKPELGRLSVLKVWHDRDPVDASERRRNEIIFERYQHNRNPFIDHPEWVDSIF
ncbi:endonuclease I family protein [Actinoplanes sichuanensis]|uniref:Endonuclease I family protein n=1 Tax=Actinoplanes sichuanensis TaxID=512349 RepID=A0ABW4AGV5_9ACTN|nr:endonuclease [Actinoplanes sichuanensis]BEL02608.1 endonuclease I family protein [Actinoplanes sichuanensis]